MKNRILAISNGRQSLDDIPFVVEKINVAMLEVARDTLPLRLLVTNGSKARILRRVSKKALIKYPTEVTDTTEDIEMDDNLLDAVAYFVISSIEVNRAAAYTKLYWRVIELHETSLINETIETQEIQLQDFVNDTPMTIKDI